MNKKDLLKFCRYYKGNDNIKPSDPDTQAFYRIEQMWVYLRVNKFDETSDIFSKVLSEYLLAGLREFEKYDDTPITLKALLFNRFIKYNERVDIEGFKEWYYSYCKG